MQNQAYWEARSLARSAVYNRSATRVVNITQHAVERSLDTLKREIDDVLRVYSKRHSLTREEALALLRSPVDMATQKRLEAEIASITDPAARRMMQAKIEASSYAARLTRAQAMQDRIVLESVKVAEVEQEALKNHLAYTYMDGIDRFMYDASRGVGRMFEYARPSVKEAQEVLRHRWAGGNYSSRVWGNANYMVKSLETALTENMLAGKPGKETWQELVNAAGGVVSHAQRLIRTETAYIAGQAEKQGYERAGFAEYKFIARLEAITCPVCGKLDGQLFPVRDAVAGKNLPPIHPWCRCTTMPWDKAVEAAMNDSDTRWAKDPETGKVVEVPMSMTYSEWKAKQKGGTTPNPAPAPKPAPKPTPKPQPKPAPKPAPAPIPKPVPAQQPTSIPNPAQPVQPAAAQQQPQYGIKTQAVIDNLKKSGIATLEVKKYDTQPTMEEIIKSISGGDKTDGSCASMSLTYAGNRAGYNVRDFRDGKSRGFFANRKNSISIGLMEDVKSSVISSHNDVSAAKKLMKGMEKGKEYILYTGCHSSVIRRLEDRYEYLELQSASHSGWNRFSPDLERTLRWRFGCKKSRTLMGQKYEVPNLLIDLDSLTQNKGLPEILSYLNTEESKQMKGASGYAK